MIKVGPCGIHNLVKCRGAKDGNFKLLLAFSNGAVGVYNFSKRCIEFQTEAGHAETIFDLEF